MVEIEVAVPPDVDLFQAAPLLERVCAGEGLRMTLKGTLARYPGSVHWHFRRGRERGTLELTLWIARRRLWFKVSAGRSGAWIEPLLPQLKHASEAALQAGPRVPASHDGWKSQKGDPCFRR